MENENPEHGFQFPGVFELTAMGAAEVLRLNPRHAGARSLLRDAATLIGLVDTDRQPILDAEEVYSGCYAHLSVTSFAYDNESKGVGFFLNNIMKARDGEPFGSNVSSPDEDFADIEVEGEDDSLI